MVHKRLIAGSAVMLLCVAAAAAADINVPQDAPTIQAAIDLATGGDRVLVAPGTYRERIDFSGKDITVASTGGAQVTVIDGEGEPGFVVTFAGGETRDAVLRGFTITGGFGQGGSGGAGPGGGVLIEDAAPVIEDCVLVGNAGLFGGGMHVAGASDALVRGTRFAGNGALRGGGVYVEGGVLTVTGSQFEDNDATNDGGAIAAVFAASLVMTDTDLVGNASGQLGGALYAAHATLDLARVNFLDNGRGETDNGGQSWTIDTLGGGGIYTTDTSGRIDAARFLRNLAAYGSGIYIAGSGTLEVVNTLVADGRIGTPVWANASSPVLVNCTIADNAFTFAGIYTTYNAFPTVTNTIIVGNGSPTAGNGLTTLRYCLYDDTPYSAQVEEGNVLASDALLDPAWDWAPLAGSPAIDAGDNSAVPAGVTVDLFGNLRIVDDPDTPDSGNGEGAIVDIGAVEFGSWAPGLNSTTNVAVIPALGLSGLHAAPNPFNPRTEVRFVLGGDADVRVDILDARGRRVRSLQAGALAAGSHAIAWDGLDGEGRGLATGVYLAVVQAADARQTVKLTLVR